METPKIGFVLEVATCYLQSKLLWSRILNNKEHDDNEQETSEMQFEDYALKSNAARAFASASD